jgi:glycosyltransferase involved in cell wall biosynthesis
MKESISVAYLTAGFLDGSSLSINYYIAILLRHIERFFKPERVTVFSHKTSRAAEHSLLEVMLDYDLPGYGGRANVLNVDCMDASDYIEELRSYDLIVSTFYLWGDVVERLKAEGGEAPKIIYWLPSILLQEYVVGRQNRWYRFDLSVESQKKLVRHADHVIFNSHHDLQLGRKFFGDMIRRASVIYPVSASPSCGEQNHFSQAVEGHLTFGFAGRWDYRKGIQFLVESFFRYFAEFGNASLHILSDPVNLRTDLNYIFEPVLRREFCSLYECGAIKLFSWERARKEYLKFLCSCDIMVFPSLYDPFNMVAYDCLFLNIPTILSRFCGVEEIALEGDCPVEKVNPLDGEEMYAAMRTLARRVERNSPAVSGGTSRLSFDMEDMLGETFNIYRDLLSLSGEAYVRTA